MVHGNLLLVILFAKEMKDALGIQVD